MSSCRDVLVIGASAGGLDAVATLLSQLPGQIRAGICVVVHVPPGSDGSYVRMLDRATPLPVRRARDGDTFYHANAYVAPPDHHLQLGPGHLQVRRGPRENGSRPAIDPLFRSAAATYGARVVGVLLTGYLDDGVAGLAAIRRHGGLTIVQDPDDAEVPDLPLAGLARVDVDHCVPLHRMGAIIARAVGHEAVTAAPTGGEAPAVTALEGRIAAGEPLSLDRQERIGDPANMGCPECGGPLFEIDDPDVRRYRCHIGHAYSTLALLTDQSDQVERALGAALRTLEERARLLADLAADARSGGRERDARSLDERAATARGHAAALRAIVLGGGADPSGVSPAPPAPPAPPAATPPTLPDPMAAAS